jgi:mycothiol synthase
MSVPEPPVPYSARPPVLDDAEQVAGLIAASQRADRGTSDMTVGELLQDWSGVDLNEEAIVVVGQDGSIVGAADILNRSYVSVSVYGYVHPEHHGRGIGRYLVEWGESWARKRMYRAPAGARVVVQHYLIATNQPARRLLETMGYRPVRGVYTMGIDLRDVPPPPTWPDGIRVRSFVPGQDELAAHEAHEDAFRDVWGRPRSTLERFVGITRQDGFDPSLWFLAEDLQAGADGITPSPAVAGVCLAKMVADRGWIDVVGVRRPWRTRGLGLAMLRHAFAEFYRRGVTNVGLSVDAESITGAPRLYFRAGMHVTGSYIIHQKQLRPGIDLGMRMAPE